MVGCVFISYLLIYDKFHFLLRVFAPSSLCVKKNAASISSSCFNTLCVIYSLHLSGEGLGMGAPNTKHQTNLFPQSKYLHLMLNKIISMIKIPFFLLFLCFFSPCLMGQTPLKLSLQNNYTYTESFSDITNWTFSAITPVDGTFTGGIGASCWKGCVTQFTGTIPEGKKITTPSTSFTTSTTGGIQKGSGSITLLATGPTDNSSSAAFDLFLDFTGLNAGTLSFDWSTIINSTGNRNATLKVYSTIDGNTFTDLSAAQVLNVSNGVVVSGSIVNVNLPSDFNNTATARLRFYVYNGTGGTTGSRPKINIDNVNITAYANAQCTSPLTQPDSILFSVIGSNNASGSFNASLTGADKYLMVLSANNAQTITPIDSTVYSIGDDLNDAVVVSIDDSLTFNLSALNPSTIYYLSVFSYNDLCNGGPKYNSTNPLTAAFTTTSGILPCVTPSTQPSNFIFSSISPNGLIGTFNTSPGINEYLIVRSNSSTLNALPTNTTTFNSKDSLGGGIVVYRGPSNSFVEDSLLASTTYFYHVFSIVSQDCSFGPVYNTANPLVGSATTLSNNSVCNVPNNQPTNLILNGDNSSVSGTFSTSTYADSYLVLYSTSSSLSQFPINGVSYNSGSAIGNAFVLSNSTSNSFVKNNLTASTTYYFYVFAENAFCSGGPKYNTISPLSLSFTTASSGTYNFYYGNLHAHSSYSDGNKDSTAFTPANDYAYAKNSLGMDFLGISEHNHAGAGMSINNWPLGVAQANAATTSTFVGLYGQEWGVISNGGHILIYGIDSLIGWETNNYQIYVAKSDYTGPNGLFRKLNANGNAFATYAHPDGTDYNNISNLSFNNAVDSSAVGCAVESGPAFSTSTTYNDYPTSMSFLGYYTKLLAKGYHLGPLMDHDTHYTNFGRANEDRLVVLAPSLTKSNLIAAMKARRFYATQDLDTKINFTVNNQVMGSVFSGNAVPVINIVGTDPTAPVGAIKNIKLMYGIPGSGVLPTQLSSSTTGTLAYSHTSLAIGTSVYYYVDMTINGKRSISAPIWYTKTNVVTPSVSISTPLSITESNLNGNVVDVTLSNETFVNFSTNPTIVNLSSFTLNNAPIGTSIGSVQLTSANTAKITLQFNQTDFDQSISNFSISISGSILTSAVARTSNVLAITSLVEVLNISSITSFGKQRLATSASEKVYYVSGSSLTGSVIINAPTGFLISTTSNAGYTNSISLVPNAGVLNSTAVYVVFAPPGLNVYNANVSNASQNAVTKYLPVSGYAYITDTACNTYLWNGVTYTTSGEKAFTTTGSGGLDSTATLLLTINNCSTSLHLKLFLEGYYNVSQSMSNPLYSLGLTNQIDETDSIVVNLWNPTNLNNIQPDFSIKGILQSNGNLYFNLPAELFGQLFYVAIKHRNSIETWSASPILIQNSVFYDFSNNITAAFNDGINPPLKYSIDNVHLIYSGDINQDGAIDIFDMQVAENAATSIEFGYNASDCNGDGSTDIFDLQIIENNSTLFIFNARPF